MITVAPRLFFVRQHNHFRLTECEFGSGVTVDDSVGSRLAARGKFFLTDG